MEEGSRRLLIVRHGERCDFTFSQQGVNWIKRAFDSTGKYHQFDLNLPRNLPKRKDGYESFLRDSPLTEMGYLQSKITGRALKDRGIKITHVFCSAALRCVQTAIGITKGMDCRTLKINVEPGLFEWTRWCRGKMPSWMNPEDLTRLGYSINTSYQPFVKSDSLNVNETLNEFYNRSYSVVQNILAGYSTGTILLVTHGPSMDALSRQLCGGEPLNQDDFMYKLHQIPYLACLQLSEQSENKTWHLEGSPIPPLTHSCNTSFDTRLFSFNPPFVMKDIDPCN